MLRRTGRAIPKVPGLGGDATARGIRKVNGQGVGASSRHRAEVRHRLRQWGRPWRRGLRADFIRQRTFMARRVIGRDRKVIGEPVDQPTNGDAQRITDVEGDVVVFTAEA